jgi:hypothetical protein
MGRVAKFTHFVEVEGADCSTGAIFCEPPDSDDPFIFREPRTATEMAAELIARQTQGIAYPHRSDGSLNKKGWLVFAADINGSRVVIVKADWVST